MPRFPRPSRSWRAFESRPDEFEAVSRRVGPWGAGPAAGAAPPGGRARGGGAPPRKTSQRDFNVIARPRPVDVTNVAKVLDRRRANDLLSKGHKGKLEAPRVSQAISAASAQTKAVSRARAAGQRAKAIAADRRMFNPTSGPKTFYGTFARIEPKSGGRFRFVLPANVVPCVQRATRREVLFAKGHGGSGFRKRKKYGPHSHIGC